MSTGTEPRQPDRTVCRTFPPPPVDCSCPIVQGTWYFRSAVSGTYPRKPYEVSDDIESFIHVYHYAILRFHQTDQTNGLAAHFSLVYEQQDFRPEDGAYVGSMTKFLHMRAPTSFITLKDNSTLELVLRLLAKLYSQHYATIDKAEYDRKYDPSANKTNAAASEKDQGESGGTRKGQNANKRLIAALEGPTSGPSIPANRTLQDHGKLLELFSVIGGEFEWPSGDLTKSNADLFKMAGMVHRKTNGFSSSMQTQGQSSQDSVHVQKKRRANTGSALASVSESQESFGFGM